MNRLVRAATVNNRVSDNFSGKSLYVSFRISVDTAHTQSEYVKNAMQIYVLFEKTIGTKMVRISVLPRDKDDLTICERNHMAIIPRCSKAHT